MDDKNGLMGSIGTLILGVHLILTASVIGGSVVILLFKRLEFWPNLLTTIFTSLIIYKVYYSKIFPNKTKINIKLIGITLLILLILLGITYMRINYKMFNCSADLGWHIYYTFRIRQDYNLTEFLSILLPFQLSTFNYPGIYFFLNLFVPFNFSLDFIPYINFLFNLVSFVFYSFIGITISLITVYTIRDIFEKKSQSTFFATYIIYLLLDIPSDYVFRGNVADLVGFFYIYSSIYSIIVLWNISVINLFKFTVISTFISYFLHPYATLYYLIIDLFIFLHLFMKLHTKFFKKIFHVDLLLYTLVILFLIITVHPLSPSIVTKTISLNNWIQNVQPLHPVAFQFSYLQLNKIRLIFDIFLSLTITFLFAILPFTKQINRIKIFNVVFLTYVPYYLLYLLPIFGIQIEPHRFVWRSFDFIPLFILVVFFTFKLINNIKSSILFLLILLVLYTFGFLTYTKSIYTPDYESLNPCGRNPQVIYNITQTLLFLLTFPNYSIVIFAEQVPYCTYFQVLNLLNPTIKVYPLSSSVIYILRGDIQNNLRELYNKYLNCNLFSNYIYIYSKDYVCSSCYNCTIYTNFGLKIVMPGKTS